jgi:hypothetical protein
VAISADRNVIKNEAEKIRYKGSQMWDMKYMIILVIIGATGVVAKGLKENLEAIKRKYSVDSLQKKNLYVVHHTSYGRHCNLKL